MAIESGRHGVNRAFVDKQGRLKISAGDFQTKDIADQHGYFTIDTVEGALDELAVTTQGLDAGLAQIEDDVEDLTTDLNTLSTSVDSISEDVSTLQSDVSDARTDIADLQIDLSEVVSDVAGLQTTVTELTDTTIPMMQEDIDGLVGDMDMVVNTSIPAIQQDIDDALGDIAALDADKEDVSNKVTSMSSSSTDQQYPSAKAVYDAIQAIIVSGGFGPKNELVSGTDLDSVVDPGTYFVTTAVSSSIFNAPITGQAYHIIVFQSPGTGRYMQICVPAGSGIWLREHQTSWSAWQHIAPRQSSEIWRTSGYSTGVQTTTQDIGDNTAVCVKITNSSGYSTMYPIPRSAIPFNLYVTHGSSYASWQCSLSGNNLTIGNPGEANSLRLTGLYTL